MSSTDVHQQSCLRIWRIIVLLATLVAFEFIIALLVVLFVIVLIAHAGPLITIAIDYWVLVLAGLVIFACFLYRIYQIREEEAHSLWRRTRKKLTGWLEEFMGN